MQKGNVNEDVPGQRFSAEYGSSEKLYHEAAEGQPIIDYHCHLNPREIWEDIRYENITQVWLGGDHYKWRLMRSAGVPEKYITGDASDREKFDKFAEVVGKAVGNPCITGATWSCAASSAMRAS